MSIVNMSSNMTLEATMWVTEVSPLKWFGVQKEMMKLDFCLQTVASWETLLVHSVTHMLQPKKKPT